MGELSALVASEALPFEAALRLARRRGELMKRAGEVSPGGMAAVLGADLATVERLCAEASTPDEIVQVANDNCPGQYVISGARAALERLIQLAPQAGVRKIRPLAVSIAAHSPLMAHAQEDFNQAVAEAPIHDPAIALVGNVSALPLTTAGEIRARPAPAAQLTGALDRIDPGDVAAGCDDIPGAGQRLGADRAAQAHRRTAHRAGAGRSGRFRETGYSNFLICQNFLIRRIRSPKTKNQPLAARGQRLKA